MKCLTYKKCLSALCLESLELRRLKADLIACFKILRGFINVIPSDFFVWSSCHTRGHSMKLYNPDSRVTVRQFFSLFVWFKYGTNCQKKWYQPHSAGSVSAFVRVHVYSSLCHLNLQSRNSIPILFAHR